MTNSLYAEAIILKSNTEDVAVVITAVPNGDTDPKLMQGWIKLGIASGVASMEMHVDFDKIDRIIAALATAKALIAPR